MPVSGHTAVIGASGANDNSIASGSGYVFRGLSDCQPNGVPDECDIASGNSADCNCNGVADECEGLGDLNCDGVLNAFDIDPFVELLIGG